MFRALSCPSLGARQTAVAASGFRMNVEVDVFSAMADGLLMMGIIIPKTCWAVSVRQNNKILRLIVASSWVFYLSVWKISLSSFFIHLCVPPTPSPHYTAPLLLLAHYPNYLFCPLLIYPSFPHAGYCSYTYLLTYLLTPWSRVLLEKLTGKLCS
jgi:hypothetical protein